jgi:lycopene beta-cyclase
MIPCSSFDVAVLGAGCAGFQLLHQFSLQPTWPRTTTALFSEGVPQQRSWCFWSKEQHSLQHLVSKSWQQVTFRGRDFIKTASIAPYQYHYIAGETFFDYFHQSFLPKHPNISLIERSVTGIEPDTAGYRVRSLDASWQARAVFSSLPPATGSEPARFWLKQHFKGWFVRTEQPVFDATTLTIMDFSIAQQNDVRFVYILPFSSHEALLEMTVFSQDIYPDATYDDVLRAYFEQHFPGTAVEIKSTERGQIPMTDALFSRRGAAGEVLLGTAAGMVKASTGYAFKRISRDCRLLAEDVSRSHVLRWPITTGRFRFYDRLLLGIIADEPHRTSHIFEALFKNVPMTRVLEFLDEDTRLSAEIHLFSQLPFGPFLRQLYKQWRR